MPRVIDGAVRTRASLRGPPGGDRLRERRAKPGGTDPRAERHQMRGAHELPAQRLRGRSGGSGSLAYGQPALYAAMYAATSKKLNTPKGDAKSAAGSIALNAAMNAEMSKKFRTPAGGARSAGQEGAQVFR